MKKRSVVLLLTGLLFSVNGFSAEVSTGLRAAYHAHRGIISHLRSGDIAPVAQKALESLVLESVKTLRDLGETTLADQYESDWNHTYSTTLVGGGQLGSLELGDFAPLNQWLANLYFTLWDKTHGMVRGFRIVEDVHAMNYALGVVLRPNGDWRTKGPYDRIEYRKHFIPMANIATYWASLEACKKYAPQQLARFCDMGASKLEYVMGRYIAPKISDFVFAKITHTQSNQALSNSCGFSSEEEFENSVMNDSLVTE